jgi:hypothetical protein
MGAEVLGCGEAGSFGHRESCVPIAGVVFLFCPIRTGTQILINVGALIVALICGVIIHNLDDSDGSRNSGYWPQDSTKSALYRDPLPKKGDRPESSGSAP